MDTNQKQLCLKTLIQKQLLCKNHRKLRLKWRYFSPDNTDERNPMRKLDQIARDQIRTEIYKLICDDGSLRTLAVICSAAAAYDMPSVATQDDVYNLTYKPISERFQYHLQDISKPTGRKEFGIIVGDHRGVQDDKRLRAHHQKLLHSGAEFVSKYENLIEGLFLEPSHLSVGIQLADMVAGAIWRKYERNDSRWYDMLSASLRRSATGEIPGYGVIKVPKTTWR